MYKYKLHIALMIVIVILLLNISVNSYFSSFTSMKWQKYPSMRAKMVGDMLLKNIQEEKFERTTKNKIIGILGKPDYDSKKYFSYTITKKTLDWGLDFYIDEKERIIFYKVRIL